MKLSFNTFGNWGDDAKIVTSAYRRKENWRPTSAFWIDEWDNLFAYEEHQSISAANLAQYRKAYDDLLARLSTDLNVTRARVNYTTTRVSLNASAPRPRNVN